MSRMMYVYHSTILAGTSFIQLDFIFIIKKKRLEISVFENSIIRWVYKVVKEALKKSKTKSRSVLLGDMKHLRSGSEIEEGEVQTLVNN